MYFNCFGCSKVTPLIGTAAAECPSCHSTNGEIITPERFNEGFKSGVFFNIDPKTGKRAKKKRE